VGLGEWEEVKREDESKGNKVEMKKNYVRDLFDCDINDSSS